MNIEQTGMSDSIKNLAVAQANVQKEIEQYDTFTKQTKDLLKNTTKTYIKQNDLKRRKKEIE